MKNIIIFQAYILLKEYSFMIYTYVMRDMANAPESPRTSFLEPGSDARIG